MKFSVIVPSFNQGAFIGETLESILSSHRQDLELIVIDGGSSDETLDVLRAFSNRIAYWCLEPDRGQTHAINKGLARMSGDVWSYQNSDDLVLPGALDIVAQSFVNSSCHWVSGSARVSGSPYGQRAIVPKEPEKMEDYILPWFRGDQYVFPFSGACYMSRNLFEKTGYFDESYDFSMDMEYYARARLKFGYRQEIISDELAVWRWHGQSKTMMQGISYGFRQDEIAIAEKYLSYVSPDVRGNVLRLIEKEKTAVAARKSLYFQRQGAVKDAKETLLAEIQRSPRSLISREFLGAMRRVFLRSPEAERVIA